MEVRCDGLQAWRSGVMGGKHGGQMLLVGQARRSGVWVASMEVRCNGLQA